MARLPRIVLPGVCHHVVQRGNNKQDVFLCKADYVKYVEILRHYAQKHSCGLGAYCLMPNHIHLVARPGTKEALPKMMHGLNLCYQQHLNDTTGFTGHVWQSRYYSSPVEEGNGVWKVVEYIDKNPLRAGLVADPCDYQYSSAVAHEQGRLDNVITEVLFPGREAKDYAEILHGEQLDARDIERIRKSTHKGMPIGGSAFKQAIEKLLGKPLSQRRVGRPKKKPEN